MPTAQELAFRSHSWRNYSPGEFIEALDAGETKADLREALGTIESGRFDRFLEAASAMFDRLDADEQELFTRRNPDLVEWVSLWNRLNEFNPYDGRDQHDWLDLAWSDPEAPPYKRPPIPENRTLIGDMKARRRSYRNWSPYEFLEVAEDEDGKLVVRTELLERVEAGRFKPMLRAGHKFFTPLDPDERKAFAERNPGIIMWISAYGKSEHLLWGEQLFSLVDVEWPTLGEVQADAQKSVEDLETEVRRIRDEVGEADCQELRRRARRLAEIADEYPTHGLISQRLKTEWRRVAQSVHFAAERADCIDQAGRVTLGKAADEVRVAIGDRFKEGVIEDYEDIIDIEFNVIEGPLAEQLESIAKPGSVVVDDREGRTHISFRLAIPTNETAPQEQQIPSNVTIDQRFDATLRPPVLSKEAVPPATGRREERDAPVEAGLRELTGEEGVWYRIVETTSGRFWRPHIKVTNTASDLTIDDFIEIVRRVTKGYPDVFED